jgi:hypothetical protein
LPLYWGNGESMIPPVAVEISPYHSLTGLSANAFHENAVYVKSESAILMLFSMLSFLKPTFLS